MLSYSPFSVYGLHHANVVYVGVARNPVRRFAAHYNPSKLGKLGRLPLTTQWLIALSEQSIMPTLRIFSVGLTKDEALTRERRVIRWLDASDQWVVLNIKGTEWGSRELRRLATERRRYRNQFYETRGEERPHPLDNRIEPDWRVD